MSDVEQVAPSDERFHARYLWAITVVTGIALWVVPMFSSFWLDETVTVWVIEDDLGTAIRRAFDYQQSPLYFVIAWVTRQLVGSSEFALRLPSLLFSIAAAWLLYRLARRLHDREAGRLIVLAFVASPWMALAASDARTYALGVLAIVAAWLALVRWFERGTAWDVAWVAVASAAAIWSHYVFGITVAALFLWAGYRIGRGGTGASWAGLAGAAAGTVLLASPLVSQVVSLLERTDRLTIPGPLSLEGLMTYLARPVVFGGLLLGVLAARALGPLTLRMPGARQREAWGMWLTWGLAAPLGYFALAALTPLSFLAPRYWASAVPALAAWVGLALAAVGPTGARRVVAAVMALATVIALTGSVKFDERWREAAAFVRSGAADDTVVLMRAGLIESAQPAWLTDPALKEYLTTPAIAYDFGGEVIPMPYLVDERSERYLEQLVDGPLAGVDRFFFVARDPGTHGTEHWLDGRLAQEGFEGRQVGTFGAVYVVEFTRSKP